MSAARGRATLGEMREHLRKQAAAGVDVPEGRCIKCKQPFEDGVNVFTEAGRLETKITQLCEKCFDEVTEEPEE